MRDHSRPVDAPLFVHDGKQVVRGVSRLRRAQKQKPAGAQREVEQFENLSLDRPLQVDEHVSTGNQIDMRERRVTEQAMRRKKNAFPYRLGDNVMHTLPG